jgi:hypothetical protein
MELNIMIKIVSSSLAMPIYYHYNKSGKEKTPGSVGTQPGADSTGFRTIEPR